MDSERLKQIEKIYHAALEIQPDERESFFREHCGADENLRREVESLLSFENTSDSLIDTPPESLAAEMLYGRAKNLKGKKLGHYKILSLLGKGGMGAVYLAEDIKLDRKIAVKLLSKEFGRDTDKLNRFVREARRNTDGFVAGRKIGAGNRSFKTAGTRRLSDGRGRNAETRTR
jgi:serine/threonine-protein kinase